MRRMRNRTLMGVAVFGSTMLLSGCATTDMQNAIGQIGGSLSELGKTLATPGTENSGPTSASVGQGGTSMTSTKLMGVFNRSPSTDGRAPEWPKVAISNLIVPTEQASASRARLRRADCITFDAVLWYDSKNNEKFSNVSLCATELPKRSNGFVTTWRTFPISGKTSGQVRGTGPTPPLTKLPSDPLMDRWMTGVGVYFIGSMLTMMGYDPQFFADDRRFWVRNVQGS